MKIIKSPDLILVDKKTFLKLQKFVANAMAEAIISGDQEAFQEIIVGYLSLVHEEELAKTTKLPIELIRTVRSYGDYNIETLLKITSAINKAAA